MSSYLADPFPRFINKSLVKTAAEIGSRDAADALAILKYYNLDRVFVFEPNPEAIIVCKKNVGINEKVTLVEAAVSDKAGTVKFYPVVESYQADGSSTANFGASSMLKASGLYGETYKQTEIEVPAIRMDDYFSEAGRCIPDLICMDVQGYELNVLKSIGSKIFDVSYIITEATVVNQYTGQSQLHHINEFLCDRGFRLVAVDMAYWGFGNFLYANRNVEIPIVGS